VPYRAAAGVSFGLVNHLPRKDVLVAEAYRHFHRQLLGIRSLLRMPDDPRSRLQALFTTFAPNLAQDVLNAWLVFWSLHRHSHRSVVRTGIPTEAMSSWWGSFSVSSSSTAADSAFHRGWPQLGSQRCWMACGSNVVLTPNRSRRATPSASAPPGSTACSRVVLSIASAFAVGPSEHAARDEMSFFRCSSRCRLQ
jgi:hypothetical protein